MRCSTDEVDLDLGRLALGGVVGFEAVVTVGGLASAAVEADESDVAGFEEPVEVYSSEGTVVGDGAGTSYIDPGAPWQNPGSSPTGPECATNYWPSKSSRLC